MYQLGGNINTGDSAWSKLLKETTNKILAAATGVISGNTNKNDNSNGDLDFGLFNLTEEDFLEFKQNLSYTGYHVTIFEDTSNCRLEDMGTRANVYWIWQTNFCTPINPHGDKSTMYYRLYSDGSLRFGCRDQYCRNCEFIVTNIENSETCVNLKPLIGVSKSVRIGRPYIHSWESDYGNASIVANVFYTNLFCLFHPRYIEPQILSSHVNIGK